MSARVIIVFFLSFFSYLLLAVSPTHAQSNPYITPNTENNVPKHLGTWIQNVTIEVVNSINCQLLGVNTANPNEKCLGVNQKTGQIGFVENGGGMIGLTSNMIGVLFTPPTSTSEYMRYMASDFGIVKGAYAQQTTYPQGFGYASISPLLKLWGIFRNITYLLFVIVFVVIGMAIMLRIHIDPRTVMSVQNQIPKLIIGLIMVTFSFGIAGFLIDVMWFSTYLTMNVIAQADPKTDLANLNSKLYTPPIGFANEALKDKQGTGTQGIAGSESHGILKLAVFGGGSVKDLITSLFSPSEITSALLPKTARTQCAWWDFVGACNLSPKTLIEKTIPEFVSAILGAVLGIVIGGLAILVFTIAILVALFRLWLSLLQAYIYLLLDIVFAPFWLIASLFPGSPLTIGSWIRDLLANLSAFPVAIAFIMLGKVFMNSFATAQGAPFPVPLIGNPGQPNVLSALIGIGIILLTPVIVQMMRDVFKAPQFKYAQTMGQSLGAGTGFAGNIGSGVWSRMWKVSAQGGAIGPLASAITHNTNSKLGRFAGFILGTHRPH